LVAIENDASKCIETFCYTILASIGFYFSVKVVPWPNLQGSTAVSVLSVDFDGYEYYT